MEIFATNGIRDYEDFEESMGTYAEVPKLNKSQNCLVGSGHPVRHSVSRQPLQKGAPLRDINMLKAIDREQQQLLQWALKGFPESQVETENKRLNKARERLRTQKTELDTQIKPSRKAAISLPNLERFVQIMQNKLATLGFEGKREVLGMLDIEIWLDGEKIEITGVIPVEDDTIVTTSS